MKFSYNQLYSESFAGGFQKTQKPVKYKDNQDKGRKKNKKDYSEERSRKRGEVNFD